MATALRNLLHEGQSPSILRQLGIKKRISMRDVALSRERAQRQAQAHMRAMGYEPGPDGAPEVMMPPYGMLGLVTITVELDRTMTWGPRDNPPLDQFQKFNAWWNARVVEGTEDTYTRAQVVLALASQDGGAHVAPTLQGGTRVWSATAPATSPTPTERPGVPQGNIALAAVRQIASEVMETLERSIPEVLRGEANADWTFDAASGE